MSSHDHDGPEAESVPLSRPILLADAGAVPTLVEVVATEAEIATLTALLDLVTLTEVTARLEVVVDAAGTGLKVTGRLRADPVQRCGISLKPVPCPVDVAVSRHFVPAAALDEVDDDGEIVVSVEEDAEELDPFDGRSVDLGDVVIEEVALALDPYPRHPEAAYEGPSVDTSASAEPGMEPGAERQRPFAALAKLARPSDDKAE